MDLLYIWHDNRHWSKILFGIIPAPAHDLKVKVMDLETYVNPYLAIRDNSRAGGGLPTQKPVILTIYHMQPFRASVLIQE